MNDYDFPQYANVDNRTRAMSNSSRLPQFDHNGQPINRQYPYDGKAIYDTPSSNGYVPWEQTAFDPPKPCASEIPLMENAPPPSSLYYTPPSSMQHLAQTGTNQGNYMTFCPPPHANQFMPSPLRATQYPAGSMLVNSHPFMDNVPYRPRSSSTQFGQMPQTSGVAGEPILPTDLRDAKGAPYRFDTFLGKGGFGNVYLVHSPTNDTQFAIKVIQKARFRKPTHRDKVVREIDLNSRMSHPNIVACHASFEDPNNMYLVLEYCEHDSLMTLLKSRTTITEAEARIYLRQICRAVIYMTEEKKVMHCDLKLGNIYLDHKMAVKIGDFGLAMDMADLQRPRLPGESKRGLCGTPNYLAPELLEDALPTLGSECWAIGCALYALLCGKPPFEASDVPSTYARVKNGKYQLPRHLSKEAAALIRLILVRYPRDRPSMRDILLTDFCQEHVVVHPLTCEHLRRAPRRDEMMPAVSSVHSLAKEIAASKNRLPSGTAYDRLHRIVNSSPKQPLGSSTANIFHAQQLNVYRSMPNIAQSPVQPRSLASVQHMDPLPAVVVDRDQRRPPPTTALTQQLKYLTHAHSQRQLLPSYMMPADASSSSSQGTQQSPRRVQSQGVLNKGCEAPLAVVDDLDEAPRSGLPNLGYTSRAPGGPVAGKPQRRVGVEEVAVLNPFGTSSSPPAAIETRESRKSSQHSSHGSTHGSCNGSSKTPSECRSRSKSRILLDALTGGRASSRSPHGNKASVGTDILPAQPKTSMTERLSSMFSSPFTSYKRAIGSESGSNDVEQAAPSITKEEDMIDLHRQMAGDRNVSEGRHSSKHSPSTSHGGNVTGDRLRTRTPSVVSAQGLHHNKKWPASTIMPASRTPSSDSGFSTDELPRLLVLQQQQQAALSSLGQPQTMMHSTSSSGTHSNHIYESSH